jgi:hypothetical protein
MRRQQVGRLRRIVFNCLDRTDRCVNDVEAIIRVREGTTNPRNFKGLRILRVSGRAISQLNRATYSRACEGEVECAGVCLLRERRR